MAIARVRSDTDTATDTVPTATFGTAPAEGNLLVCALRVSHSTLVITPRSGWTMLTQLTSTQQTALLYKIAGAAEASTLNPCDLSTSALWVCIGVEYSGTARANVLDVEGAQVDNTATKTSPAVNPADSVERVALGFVMNDAASTPWTGITIGGTSSGVSTVASGARQIVFEKILTTAAATTYAAEATAVSAADGTAHVAFFRGLNSQTVSPVAATAVGLRRLVSRALMLSTSLLATQSRGVAKRLGTAAGSLVSAAQARGYALAVGAASSLAVVLGRTYGYARQVAVEVGTAASRALLGVSGTVVCAARAVARALVSLVRPRSPAATAPARPSGAAVRSRTRTVATSSRTLTFTAVECC